VKGMALGLIDKLTNFLMPIEAAAEVENMQEQEPERAVSNLSALRARKTVNLRVHTQEAANLKVVIASPLQFEDVKMYADNLKSKISVVLNFEQVDEQTQRAIVDFLNGVCYVINGNVQRVSESILMYVPEHVDITKELYAYSVPTYVKTN
jgi:cell division inhibitor SepF